MPLQTALRALIVAVLAGACWKVAYDRAREPAPGPQPPVQIAKKLDNGFVQDAWQDIARSTASVAPKTAQSHPIRASLPTGPFAANVAELKRRAGDGDAAAALALAKGFRDCQFYVPPKNQADLQQRVEDRTVSSLNFNDQLVDFAKQHAKAAGIDPNKVQNVDAMTAYHAELNAETETSAKCTGVDIAEARKWSDWYARAAALGDPEAELGYWHVVVHDAEVVSLETLKEHKAEAATDLQQALARGDARALAAIGEILMAGWYAEPDAYTAHAYYFAASQMPNADIASLPWFGGGLTLLFTGRDTQTYFSLSLRRTAATLDAQQIATSEALGAEIYARCCGGVR
jgi:hypothetical protein